MNKYFIVSDIHSRFDLLFKALSKSEFDLKNPEHILIIAGDILDRGTSGDKVIKFIESLIKKDRILAVMGNHDKFLIDILNNHIDITKILWNIHHNGFKKTLELGWLYKDKDFEITNDNISKIRKTFLEQYPIFCEWIIQLPLYIEFSNHVIVHGFLDFSLNDWHETDERTCIWTRGYNLEIPKSFNKKLIFGHTPNYHINGQDEIIFDGNKIMIDGGAAGSRKVNILIISEDKI